MSRDKQKQIEEELRERAVPGILLYFLLVTPAFLAFRDGAQLDRDRLRWNSVIDCIVSLSFTKGLSSKAFFAAIELLSFTRRPLLPLRLYNNSLLINTL